MTDHLEETLILARVPEFVDDAGLGLDIAGEVAGDVDDGNFNRNWGHHGVCFFQNGSYSTPESLSLIEI